MRTPATTLSALLLLATLVGAPVHAQVAGSIVVYPTTSTLEVTSTRQFTAYVPINPNTITWLVNDIPGGNSTVGTISPAGLYTPPAVIPAANVLAIKAKSTAFPATFGIASLTLTRPFPSLWSVSPSTITLGAYSVRFNGANFASDSQALANGVAVTTKVLSSTSIVATGTATELGTLKFAVRQPGLGAVTGNSVSVSVVAAIVGVKVAPASVVVSLNQSQAFTATVTNTVNTAVTWSVNGVTGGSASTGTISTAGLYVAPAVLPSPSSVTVRATSVASPSSFAQATVTVMTPVTVSIAPLSATVPLGATQSFTAAVSGNANTSVTWSVNGVNGGSAAIGTITPAGLFTAPLVMPASSSVTVRATSVANPSSSAQAAVTLVPPISVVVAPGSVSLVLGTTQTFTATVTGTANTAVTWLVNGVAGGDPAKGTITAGGLYTSPLAMPVTGTVTVAARSVADGVTQGSAVVVLQDPQAIMVGRFLDQTTFGPTPQLMAHVRQIGLSAFLDEQFEAPESPWPSVATATRSNAIDAFFNSAVNGGDQLRQRVIFALSEIVVESMNKNTNGEDIVPWLQLLSRNAFGNYRTLLKEITIDASMGKYLDLANSSSMGSGMGATAANENYPREVMQLFSIGISKLNLDGSLQLDALNQPIPTYTQADVQALAKALTGWTYSNAMGTSGAGGNYSYYPGPMIPAPGKHNTSMKVVLGQTIPANQTIQKDLDDAIDILFNHPNIGPFIATRLIRALVTSNPSPAYIARVAAVFNGSGGTRGDMKAVIRAIILDQDARNDTPPANFGRLRTPMQHTAALSRALGFPLSGASNFAYLFYGMNEGLLDAPSVFGHYSPNFRIPKSALFGPEFQIFSPSDAINRFNFFYGFLGNPWPINPVLQPFASVASDAQALVNAVDNALFFGRMSPALRAAIVSAMPAQPDQNQRAIAALYLAITSGEYLVQR